MVAGQGNQVGIGDIYSNEPENLRIRHELLNLGARELSLSRERDPQDDHLTFPVEGRQVLETSVLATSNFTQVNELLAAVGMGQEGEIFAIVRITLVQPGKDVTQGFVVRRYKGGSSFDTNTLSDQEEMNQSFVGNLDNGPVKIGRDHQEGLSKLVSRDHATVQLRVNAEGVHMISVEDHSTNGSNVYRAPKDTDFSPRLFLNGELQQ